MPYVILKIKSGYGLWNKDKKNGNLMILLKRKLKHKNDY